MSIDKVAIFTHGITGGAFANLGTTLALGFEELGTSCDLVVLNANNEEKAKYPNINVVSLNVRGAALSLGPLISYIRRHKPNVIFPMPLYFNVIAIWAKYLSKINTKIIIGEHGISSLDFKVEHKKNLRLKYLPLLMRYTYPHSDGLIGVSKDTITDLLKEVIQLPPHIPRRVIQNPIDLERIQQLAKYPIESPWFQNQDTPVIVTAARLAKQKQQDILIRAFAEVIKIMPARLLIMGEGPLRTDLESLCKELEIEEHVAMPGVEANPYRFMSACNVFVLASAWEGCPIALEEALACGAAVIVTDAPGGSKDVIDYGKYGMMVPTGNFEALAQGIIKLLSDKHLQRRYRDQALKRSQDFQYSNICKQYLDFGDSVLNI